MIINNVILTDRFQFLGIPPKGEPAEALRKQVEAMRQVSNF